MKNLRIILLIAVVAFTRCSTIKKEHITKPGIETKNSINHWLKKNDLFNNFYIITLAPEFYFNFNLSTKIGIKPIVYSSKSKLIMLYNGCTRDSCMENVGAYINTIKPFSISAIERMNNTLGKKDSLGFEDISFQSLNIYLKTLDGKNVEFPSNPDVDYYLILPFAKFFGDKKQVKDLQSFSKLAQTNKYSKFNIVLLDMDKQKWWGKEWNDKIDFSINVVK